MCIGRVQDTRKQNNFAGYAQHLSGVETNWEKNGSNTEEGNDKRESTRETRFGPLEERNGNGYSKTNVKSKVGGGAFLRERPERAKKNPLLLLRNRRQPSLLMRGTRICTRAMGKKKKCKTRK